MIKLIRGQKPKELTDILISKLTEKFKKDPKKSVWDKAFIKEALFASSHGKCCYCETKLGEESKYMTVDHYHHKDKYPNEVVKWENLNPSCSRCNSKKGEHDTYENPIINPMEDNPKEYLYLHFYNYKSIDNSIDSLGRTTIDVLALNDSDKMVKPRIAIGIALQNKLEQICDRIQTYVKNNSDVRQKNKIIYSIADVLKSSSLEEEYSALVATIMLGDSNYTTIKNKMIEFDLWNDELTQMENNAKNICLSKDC